MAEITYFPEVKCVIAKEDGILNTQIVGVPDVTGDNQYLRIGKGSLIREGDKTYLPIGVVDVDYKNRRTLIELPAEADSGVRRIWVPFGNFRQRKEKAS